MAGSTLRERQQARVRDDIVRAVLDIVREGGVDAVTINEIVARAGLARGTFYAHFPDGRDTAVALALERVAEELVRDAHERTEGITDWRERVLAFVGSFLELARRDAVGAFYVLTAGPPSPGLGSRSFMGEFEADFTAGQESGEVTGRVRAGMLAALFAGAVREAGVRVASDPSSAEEATAALETLLDGLRRGAAE